jgi:serine protease Do
MDNDDYKEIKDVKWESLESKDEGCIKFRSTKKSGKAAAFIRMVAVILVAAVSGGAAGAYVVEKKHNESGYIYPQNNQTLLNQNDNTKTADIPANSITKVAQTVGPAVVAISNSTEGFIGEVDESSGSGIIFDPNGFVVTNNHVVEGADKITVKLSSGKTLAAKLVGSDPRTDIAVIKVEAQNLPTAKFGDSSKTKVGDVAIAIGNPLGEYAGSVTAGIISAVNRTINYAGAKYKVLQTDAAINPGNSGGALCNEAGEVIGINSLKIPTTQNAEGLGFAIAINEVKDVIKSLTSFGKVSRPYLGIYGGTTKPENNKGIQGVYVNEVVQGGGAAAAGVKPTDIIVGIDHNPVKTMEELQDSLDKHKIGDAVPCTIWRNGKNVELNIILSDSKTNK